MHYFKIKLWKIWKELYLRKKYERGKEWIEILDSFKIENNFKDLLKWENTYLESLFPYMKKILLFLFV